MKHKYKNAEGEDVYSLSKEELIDIIKQYGNDESYTFTNGDSSKFSTIFACVDIEIDGLR